MKIFIDISHNTIGLPMNNTIGSYFPYIHYHISHSWSIHHHSHPYSTTTSSRPGKCGISAGTLATMGAGMPPSTPPMACVNVGSSEGEDFSLVVQKKPLEIAMEVVDLWKRCWFSIVMSDYQMVFEDVCGGFHGHGATPKNGWFIVENLHLKWMRTRGTPIWGNLHWVWSSARTGESAPFEKRSFRTNEWAVFSRTLWKITRGQCGFFFSPLSLDPSYPKLCGWHFHSGCEGVSTQILDISRYRMFMDFRCVSNPFSWRGLEPDGGFLKWGYSQLSSCQ